MSTHPKPTLYQLAVDELNNGTQATFPDIAPLDEIAEVLATDDFWRTDPEKKVQAINLLISPLLKVHWVKLGTKPAWTPLNSLWFMNPYGGSPGVQRLPTCEEEARAKRRAERTPVQDEEDPIWGLPLAEVAKCKDLFSSQGLWGRVADIVSRTPVPSIVMVPEKVVVSEIENMRLNGLRDDAVRVCQEAGIPEPNKPMAPKDLYRLIEGPLTRRGRLPAQLYKYQGKPGKLPACCKNGHGRHIPVEVAFHILFTEEPYHPVKVKPHLTAAK